jgi:tetratricopeptide (TPR) repeat protein
VLTAPDGLARTWLDVRANPQYYPLTFTTFILERRLWGLDPVGYHVVNIILHAGSAVLVGLVLGELGVPGGWLAAALFALHPVQVESVAWVTERKNTLSGLLALAALGSYLRAGLPGSVDVSERPGRLRWGWYGLSVCLFALALLSKSVVAMLAVVLLILTWWRRPRLRPGDLYPLTPFFVLGAASGLMSAWLEVRHVGAGGSEFSRGPLDRLLVAGRVAWFYAGKLIAPVHLSFNYPRWTIDPRRPGDWLPVLGVLLIAVVLFLARRRLGKGPIVAVLGYLAMLFPVLGFLNVYPMRYSFVADHFQYHASVVFLAAMAAASVRLMPGLARRRRLAAVAALPVLVWLGSLTWSRCLVFRDPVRLWADTLTKNPSSWLAHSKLGNELAKRGRLNEAIAHYRRVIEMRPNDKSAYFELGTAYFKAHDLPRTIRVFEQGLDRPDDPGDESFGPGILENYLGTALLSLGDLDGAIAHYRKAVVAIPYYAEAHANLGGVLAARGHPSEAREHLRAALRLNPKDAEARAVLDRLGPDGDPPTGPRRPR